MNAIWYFIPKLKLYMSDVMGAINSPLIVLT
jgi:hypothetical protein